MLIPIHRLTGRTVSVEHSKTEVIQQVVLTRDKVQKKKRAGSRYDLTQSYSKLNFTQGTLFCNGL